MSNTLYSNSILCSTVNGINTTILAGNFGGGVTGGVTDSSLWYLNTKLSRDYLLGSIVANVIHSVKTMITCNETDIEYKALYDFIKVAIIELKEISEIDKVDIQHLVILHAVLGKIPTLQTLFIDTIDFSSCGSVDVEECYKDEYEALMKDIKKKILRTGKA